MLAAIQLASICYEEVTTLSRYVLSARQRCTVEFAVDVTTATMMMMLM